MTDEKAWLPTHLQQAEKVLDKSGQMPKTSKRKSHDVVNEITKRVKPSRARKVKPLKRPWTLMRQKDENLVRSLEAGKSYRLEVHNSLTNVVSRVTAEFERVDDNGILWFREGGRARYFRASAVMKCKAVK